MPELMENRFSFNWCSPCALRCENDTFSPIVYSQVVGMSVLQKVLSRNANSRTGCHYYLASSGSAGQTITKMASILDCPIVSVNARVWRFWSFVLKHDAMRYISIIPVTVMTFFMFTDLCRSWGNIQELIIKAYFAVLYFNAVVRHMLCVVQE